MDLSLLAGWPVIVEQAVAWGEMDSYGHVNNIVYFRYFENARLECFHRLGWPVAGRPTGVGPILASTQCRFRKQLMWPDRIAIGARVSQVGDDRFTLEHHIISEKLNALVAEGSGLIVTYDYAKERKAPIPDEIRRKLVELQGGPPT
jgi:acyl-CoA thioester hydrolase